MNTDKENYSEDISSMDEDVVREVMKIVVREVMKMVVREVMKMVEKW